MLPFHFHLGEGVLSVTAWTCVGWSMEIVIVFMFFHQLCNNNHNCHCDAGWAPPLCEKKGFGGSLDSGPVISHSETALFCVDCIIFSDNNNVFWLQSSSVVALRQPTTHAAGSPPGHLGSGCCWTVVLLQTQIQPTEILCSTPSAKVFNSYGNNNWTLFLYVTL